MQVSRREQLLELCGGETITDHQLAQIQNLETRPSAISDLGKVIKLYLVQESWQDEQYETELCKLALRGSELLSAINEEILNSVKSFADDPKTSLEKVLQSLIATRRRPITEKDEDNQDCDKFRSEDYITVATVHYLYWAMAIGLKPWPKPEELRDFEQAVMGILAVDEETVQASQDLQDLFSEISHENAQMYIREVMLEKIPDFLSRFYPDRKPTREASPPKLTAEELLQEEQDWLHCKSQYRQAQKLKKVVRGWLTLGEMDKAIEVAKMVRRDESRSDSLSLILNIQLESSTPLSPEILTQLVSTVKNIPLQSKRTRFGGGGRVRVRHLTRLAIYHNNAEDISASKASVAEALDCLSNQGESVYDQVDFALLAASASLNPESCLRYAIAKIKGVWNWGDQLRMFNWVFDYCRVCGDEGHIDSLCQMLETTLVRLEGCLGGSEAEAQKSLGLKLRNCLFLSLFLARGMLASKQLDQGKGKVLMLLNRLEALYDEYLQEGLKPEYLRLMGEAFIDAGYYKKAYKVIGKNRSLNRCRSIIHFLGAIPPKTHDDFYIFHSSWDAPRGPVSADELKRAVEEHPTAIASREGMDKWLPIKEIIEAWNLKEPLEEDLQKTSEQLRQGLHMEFLAQKLVLNNPAITGKELWDSLCSTRRFKDKIWAIWKLFGSNVRILNAWVESKGGELAKIVSNEMTQQDCVLASTKRQACEVLFRGGDWEESCQLIQQMGYDHQETVQLMNNPRTVQHITEKFPSYNMLVTWIDSMGLGGLTRTWIMRQWRRQVALTAANAREVILDSFKDTDWQGSRWAVRCYILACLRAGDLETYGKLVRALSDRLEFPALGE